MIKRCIDVRMTILLLFLMAYQVTGEQVHEWIGMGMTLLSFALTAFCGMSMSGYAVPFLYGMAKVSFARRMHLYMSHWAFVLMGLHLGLHVPDMTAKWKMADKVKWVISTITCSVF